MAGSAAAGSSNGKTLLKCTVWEVLATAPCSGGLAESGLWCVGVKQLGLDWGPLQEQRTDSTPSLLGLTSRLPALAGREQG